MNVQLDPCEHALPGRSSDDEDAPDRREREACVCRRGDSLVERADDFVARLASRASDVARRVLLDPRLDRCGDGADGRPACKTVQTIEHEETRRGND